MCHMTHRVHSVHFLGVGENVLSDPNKNKRIISARNCQKILIRLKQLYCNPVKVFLQPGYSVNDHWCWINRKNESGFEMHTKDVVHARYFSPRNRETHRGSPTSSPLTINFLEMLSGPDTFGKTKMVRLVHKIRHLACWLAHTTIGSST